ncbi:hypothetical protein H5410_003323 [Solanum commersonii]|uniref:Uncharacterized protein n=1 Tax=Solanum commersonii TaxID=4109 RepID=A0A9J6B4C8_SOLCO|nr:hypothetical protein H5410_003323 [Solanum commersonii]
MSEKGWLRKSGGSVLSPEGKDQVGGERAQSTCRGIVLRSGIMSPNDTEHVDAEVFLVEFNKFIVANIGLFMCFRLARERGRGTKTTRLMA